ncbi:toxin glutamine deamidase domain-containing protein [Micromonospora sp. NPDC002575]|uniref:toxin glutamine deamidase domain-containing protein n=1 Tax=Micromonospora sp. NPDC002575 TaxID=3364222 RepID=UPI0036B244CE
MDNGVLLRELVGHDGAVVALTSWQAGAGRRVASADVAGAVRVWDVDNGVLLRELVGHDGAVVALTSWQAGAGPRVASADAAGTVRIWDVDNGVVLQTFEGNDGLVRVLTSWQDEAGWRRLAGADVAGRVRIWDVDNGVVLQTLEGHDGVVALTLLPEGPGRWLLAVGQRQAVRLWSLADGVAWPAGLPLVSGERFRTESGRGSVVVYPEGVSAGIDVERLAAVAREQAVTDAEAWAARTGQDRPADDAVWRVVLAFEDRGHEDVLALAQRLIDGELGVEVPEAAVIELSPYGADPSGVPQVQSRTLVEVAALRTARAESGAVAILGRHVADVDAGVVTHGLVAVDFSGRQTFPALSWEIQARPSNEDADLDYRGRRRLAGLPVHHGPYLLPFDRDWARLGLRAFSHLRDWVFLPNVPSERGLRVTQLRQAELLAGEIAAASVGETERLAGVPDVGPAGWVPDGARVLVVGVPGRHPGDPKAVVPWIFDFLNGALPPAASGLREPVYVVVHGFGEWTSTVVLTHTAEDDLWPVRMEELATGGPAGGGLREARDLAEAEGWTRVLAEAERIAAAVGAVAPGRVDWAGELRAALPDVVGGPAAVDGQRRMGERVDQMVALGERLVGLTRRWTGEGALPVGTDRPDLRLERWAGDERNRRLAAALAATDDVVAEEVAERVEEEIDRVWDAVVAPVSTARANGTVPNAVLDVLRAVHLGAWAFYTAPGEPVVTERPDNPHENLPEGVQSENGRWIVDLSAVRDLPVADFDRFLTEHGQDVASLWSANGAVEGVSELRAALGVSPPVPHLRVAGRVPEVSEQWRAELFSAVSAFGLARQWLEEQISSLPAAAPGRAGDGAAGSGEQAVPVSDEGAAAARADLAGRWRDLADGHARRMDAADRELRRLTTPGQDDSPARSVLAGLSDRYLQEMQGLSRARMPRTVDAYVDSLPAGELGGLGDRLDQAETTAAELDRHLGQAPDPASADVVDGVELRTLEGHAGPVRAVTSWQGESGPRVASASDDGTVRIWDAVTGAPLRTLRGHTDGVVAVASWQAGSDRRLATADMQGTVFVWDAASGARLLTLGGHVGPVWAVTSWQGESGPRVASASDDGTVRIWDAATGAPLRTLGGHTGGVGAVASWQAGSDQRLATAGWDGTVYVWDAASAARLLTLRGHTGGVVAMASWRAGSDQRLATAGWDGTVRVWDAVTGAPLLALGSRTGVVWAVTSWQAGSQRLLASTSEDGTVRVWDAVTGAPLRTLGGHTGGAVAVTSWQAGSERRLTTADAHGTVRVWDADSGALLRTLEGHTGTVRTVTSLQGEPGRRVVVSASDDHTVRLWSLPENAGGPAGPPGVPDGPVDAGTDSEAGGSDSSADVAGGSARDDVLLPSQMSPAEVSFWFGWLGDVNPGRGEGFDTNCVLAAVGTDMSLADGVGWQVPPEVPSPVAWLQRYAGRPLVEVAGYDAVVEVMAGAEPGARGVLVTTGEGDEISHAVNVVRAHDGRVVFLDGQRGGLARGPVEPGRLRFVATTDGVGTPRPPSRVAEAATVTVAEHADLAGMDEAARPPSESSSSEDLPAQGSTIDFRKARDDWRKIEFRMSRYDRLWNNDELRAAYEGFKEQMKLELRLKAKGKTNEEIDAEVVERFGADRVAPFAQLMADNHAFSAPAKWWFNHQHDSDFDAQFAEAVQQFRSRLALWGKIGPAVAERITEQSGNRMLEATPGGQIFDNIMLGTGSFFNYPPGFNRMWEQFSHQLVAVTDGMIDAHVYRGVMVPSVLHNTEAKILFEKVDRREIEGLRVVAWEFVAKNKIAKAGEYVVRSQGSYNERVPKLEKGKTSKTFDQRQQQLYEQLAYRREEYNRIGLQDSLPELPPVERKGSDYVFVVSDANQPEVDESPQSLTRKWSMALESQTADNPLAQLDQILAVLEYAQNNQETSDGESSFVDLATGLSRANTGTAGSISSSIASILVPPTRRNTALDATDAEPGPFPEDPYPSPLGSDYSPRLDAVLEEWPPPADPGSPVDAEGRAPTSGGGGATPTAAGSTPKVERPPLTRTPLPHPRPRPRTTTAYQIEASSGGPSAGQSSAPFRSYQRLGVRTSPGSRPTEADFPAHVPAQQLVTHRHPPLRLSDDGTLAINGIASVSGARPVTEATEFYATDEVIDAARRGLARAGANVRLTVDSAVTVTVDHGGRPVTLRKVSADFDSPPPDVCVDFAGVVLGGVPDGLVFRAGGQTLLAETDAGNGRELLGVHHLAEGVAAVAAGDLPLAAVDPGWAAARIAADGRLTGGLTPPPLPGAAYGVALRNDRASRAEHARLSQVARRIGINEHAWPRIGEAYAVSTITSRGADGEASMTADFARGGTLANVFGYHFAAVVAQSADGKTQITLENYARVGGRRRAVDEAIERTLAAYRGRFDTVRATLERAVADGGGDPRAVDALQRRLDLAEALAVVERSGTEASGSDSEAWRSARAAMARLMDLPRAGDMWHFKMFSQRPGETFHEQLAVLYDADVPVAQSNPLTTVVVGGSTVPEPVRISFDPGSKTPGPVELGKLRWVSRQTSKLAVWRHDNGLPLPAVDVTGYGNGTRMWPGSAVATGWERANSVSDVLGRHLAQDLSTLLDGGQDVTAADIVLTSDSQGRDLGGAVADRVTDTDDLRRADVVVAVPSPGPASAGLAGRATEEELLPGGLSQAEALRRFPWLGGVNPYRGGDFETNCVLTAIGTDLSLADGVGHQVPPEQASPVAWLERYAGRPLVEAADYAAVVEVMTAAAPGARGVLVTTGEGDEISHAVNVMRTHDGKVVFLDGQRGGLARGPAQPRRLRFVATTQGVGVPRAPSTVGGDAIVTSVEELDLAGVGGPASPATGGGVDAGDGTPAGSPPEVRRLAQELADVRGTAAAVESDLAAARSELSAAREDVARQVAARAAVLPTPASPALTDGNEAQAADRAAWERLTRAQDRVAELERQHATAQRRGHQLLERAVRVADQRRQALERDAATREADWRTAVQQWMDGLQALQAGGAAAADRAAERIRQRDAAREAAERLAAQRAGEREAARQEAATRAAQRQVAGRDARERAAARAQARMDEQARWDTWQGEQRALAARKAARDAAQAEADRQEQRRQEQEARAAADEARRQQADQDPGQEHLAAEREQQRRAAAAAAHWHARERELAAEAARIRQDEQRADDQAAGQARRRWEDGRREADLAEADRVRADEDARRQEDERQRAERRAVEEERERVEAERRDADNAERQAETWRQAELRDAVDAAARTAQRARLEQHVARHQVRLDRARHAASDARTAWERAVAERDGANAASAAAKGKPRVAEPAAPWYFADGALGELSVSAVRHLTPQQVSDTVTQLMDELPSGWPAGAADDIEMGTTDRLDLGTAAQEAALRARVSAALRTLLAAPEQGGSRAAEEHRERWERALFSGETLSAGGRLVWIRPVPHEPRPTPPGNAGGPRVFGVSFGSTKVGNDTSVSSGRKFDGGLEETFDISTGRASRLIAGLPTLSVKGDRQHATSRETRVIWGRKMFVTASTSFTSGVSFQVFVNGVEWGRPSVPAGTGLLDISLPTLYANGSAAPEPAAQVAPSPSGPPALSASQAREVLNAIDLTPLVTGWHQVLSAALPADTAAGVAAKVTRQLLNERTMRNRSRWVLSNGDMTDTIDERLTVGRFRGHVSTRAVLRRLQLVGVTEGVTVRDDLGVIATSGEEVSGSSGAGLDADAVLLGLTHVAADAGGREEAADRPTGAFSFGFGGGSAREAALEVGGKVLNHTVLNRREDQARYRAVFDVTMTTHGDSSVAPVTRRVVGELGVPLSEAQQFERSVFGTVFTPEFGGPGTGRPQAVITPAVAGPPPAPTPAGEIAARLSPQVLGAPQARQPYVPPAGPAPREPLALAMRRGQGLGIAANMPGAEQVADLVQSVLRQKSGRADIGAVASRTILTQVGRAAMEADPTRTQAGKKFTVRVGRERYQVLVTEHRRELLDSPEYPMTVNARALTGATTSGSRSTEGSLSGQLGGRVSVPVLTSEQPDRNERTPEPGTEHQGRVFFPRLGVAAEHARSAEHELSQVVQEYRRTETDGHVVDHRYRTVFEVAIREQTGSGWGPRETWLIGAGPGGEVATHIAVPVEHVPRDPRTGEERAVTPARLAGAGVTRPTLRPEAAWAPAGRPPHLPLDVQGSAGLYAAFRYVPELPATAARLYQQLNGLPDEWFDEPMNWPDAIFDLGAGSELAGGFPEAVQEHGWELQLPAHDGYQQVVRVRERFFAAGLTYQYSSDGIDSANGVELEQYRQSAISHSAGTSSELSLGGKAGVGGQYLNHATTAKKDGSDNGAPGKAHERGRLGGGLYVEGGVSSGGSDGRDYGAIDITRATYNDVVHAYHGGVVFEVTALRARDGETTATAPAYLDVDDAVDLLATDRAVEDLGLDRARTPTPDPTPSREIIDPELLPAAGHPERLRANAVLDTILRRLRQRGLFASGEGIPGHLRRALVNRFSSRNLEPQYLPLSGEGVYGWFPVPTPYHTTQYLWVRVSATPSAAPSSDRPREQVSLTLRGETHDAQSNTASSGRSWGGEATFTGRAAWNAQREVLGGYGDYGQGSSESSERGTQSESKDIFRTGPKRSHEFEYPLDFTVEMTLTTELPQAVTFMLDSVRNVLFGGAWLAGLWQPNLERSVRDLWHNVPGLGWHDQVQVAGDVRLIVPRYLTRPTAEQPGSWQGPSPAPALTDAGRPVPRWRESGVTPPPLNDDLINDRNVHPWRLNRAAREIERWAALTTQPPRLRQGLDLSADGAWRVPGVPRGSDFDRLMAHHASEMMLRPRLEPLLEHRYQVPGTGITVGLNLRRAEVYVDKDGRPLAFEQKARRYQQNESGPINKGGSSSGREFSFGPQGGASAGIKKVGWNGDGFGADHENGEAHAAEMSEVNERNVEAKRTFHQYRYDVTAVIYGPHGTLLVDVERGLYVMREQPPTIPLTANPSTTGQSDPAREGAG